MPRRPPYVCCGATAYFTSNTPNSLPSKSLGLSHHSAWHPHHTTTHLQWEGMLPSEATWVSAVDFIAEYPSSNLVDKVIFDERGMLQALPMGRRRMKMMLE
ncbi:unnamed protein product [Rhodiola kirilowii]